LVSVFEFFSGCSGRRLKNCTPTTVSDSQYLSLITKKADDFSFDFQIREFFQISQVLGFHFFGHLSNLALFAKC